VVDSDTEGGRAENDPRRDMEGASCGDALLSFRSETTEDARESDGMTEELLRESALSFG